MLFGMTLLIANFKIALANGVSRKTFMLANLLTALTAAAALSIFNLSVALIHNIFWPVNFVSNLFFLFPLTWGVLLALQFVLYLFAIAAGWFITLAYYRSAVPVKWAISLAPFGLYALLRVTNAFSNGAIFAEIKTYIALSTRTAFTTTMSFLAYAVIVCGLVYLLLRRASLKA